MIRWVLIILACAVMLVVLAGGLFYYQHKPDYSGQVTLNGISAPVNVLYDDAGVPHIYAQNEADAYFALGYVHAKDRLFQMEILRRAGAGKLAEIIGEKAVPADKLFRTLGINRFAQQHARLFLSNDSLPFQRATHAYQRGVNHFVETGATPIEFLLMGIPKTPFASEDVYHVVGMLAFGFAEGMRTDPVMQKIKTELGDRYLSDLALNTPPDAEKIPVFPGHANRTVLDSLLVLIDHSLAALPLPLWQGSNGWAISGSRTASGMPILANDTHMGFSQPAVWYEAHLSYPGFEFYGHHAAGLPFGLLGQNNFCAWGLTMFENDDTDFFIEDTAGKNAKVKFGNDSLSTVTFSEVIRVKGKPDVILPVTESPFGVRITEGIEHIPNSGQHPPLALCWQLTRQTNTALQAAYQLNHARSFADAEQAASRFTAPGLNVMYADRAGNIAWWAAALLPVRDPSVPTKLFLHASRPNHYYQGVYPFEKNPRAVNPPTGFVYSANNQPDSTDGVLHPGYYYPRSRAGRIRELLSEEKKWTVDDVKKVVLDATSGSHVELAQIFSAVLAASKNPDHQRLAGPLAVWDGSHAQASATPSIFYNLLSATLQAAMEDELGPPALRTLLTTSVIKNSYAQLLGNEQSPWWDDVTTTAPETRQQIIERAASRALHRLQQAAGPDESTWAWGNIHTLTHPHVLAAVKPLDKIFNVGPFAVDGGDEVINNLLFNLGTTGYFPVKSGPALRKITDLGNWQRGITISPTGQSGNLFSPHYRDQAARYVAGQFRPMYMNRAEIEKAAAHHLTLTPAP